MQGTGASAAPREVDRSARHTPRARCPQVPTSGLGVAPALRQPAAPMSSENLAGFVFFRWLDCMYIVVLGGVLGWGELCSLIHSLRCHS